MKAAPPNIFSFVIIPSQVLRPIAAVLFCATTFLAMLGRMPSSSGNVLIEWGMGIFIFGIASAIFSFVAVARKSTIFHVLTVALELFAAVLLVCALIQRDVYAQIFETPGISLILKFVGFFIVVTGLCNLFFHLVAAICETRDVK